MGSHQPPLVAWKSGELLIPFLPSSGYHNKPWILGLSLLVFVPPTFGPLSPLSSGLACDTPAQLPEGLGKGVGIRK